MPLMWSRLSRSWRQCLMLLWVVCRRGEESKAHSRYEEDVLLGNHTAVWGSWWADGAWGYACCKQTVKNSYCTGAAGEAAAVDSVRQIQASRPHVCRPIVSLVFPADILSETLLTVVARKSCHGAVPACGSCWRVHHAQ